VNQYVAVQWLTTNFRVWHRTLPAHYYEIVWDMGADSHLPLHHKATSISYDNSGILSRLPMVATSSVVQESTTMGDFGGTGDMVGGFAD
jgi:hypothetical protein